MRHPNRYYANTVYLLIMVDSTIFSDKRTTYVDGTNLEFLRNLIWFTTSHEGLLP